MNQWEKIAALGRPFDLGMLYHRRSDKLILGKTLWSCDELKSNVGTVASFCNNAEILTNDTMSEKILAVNVEGSLKMNFLCGEVNVEGAAKFLYDSKCSKHDVRVVLKYETTTQLEHLTMDHLKESKISHPEILDQDIATDVVIGIQYGGIVFITFDQEIAKNESAKTVHGEMKAHVQKLKGIVSSSNGEVSFDYTANEKQKTEKINCKAYSDFRTKENPSNYEEAVEFYKKLPSLTDNNKGVPVVVYLCSLDSLLSKRSAVVEISATLLDKACANILHLHSVLEKYEDLIEEDNFPSVTRQLSLFKVHVEAYKKFFQRKMSEFRAGSADDRDFANFLKQQEASVFSPSTLTQWLRKKHEEMKTLQGIIKALKGTPYVSGGELRGLLIDPNTYHVVCLTFKISLYKDVQVLNMEAFLKGSPMQQFEEPALPAVDVAVVHQALERFTVLLDDNAKKKVVKFVYTEEPLVSLGSDGEANALVRYYYKGSLKVENLTPLEKSRNLKVQQVSTHSVELAWDESLAHFNDIEDKVQYKTGHDQWQTSSAVCNGQVATIDDLRPATKYTFRLCAPDQIFLRENYETLEVETLPALNSINLWSYIVLVVATVASLVVIGLAYAGASRRSSVLKRERLKLDTLCKETFKIFLVLVFSVFLLLFCPLPTRRVSLDE